MAARGLLWCWFGSAVILTLAAINTVLAIRGGNPVNVVSAVLLWLCGIPNAGLSSFRTRLGLIKYLESSIYWRRDKETQSWAHYGIAVLPYKQTSVRRVANIERRSMWALLREIFELVDKTEDVS